MIAAYQFLNSYKHSTRAQQLTAHCYKQAKKKVVCRLSNHLA